MRKLVSLVDWARRVHFVATVVLPAVVIAGVWLYANVSALPISQVLIVLIAIALGILAAAASLAVQLWLLPRLQGLRARAASRREAEAIRSQSRTSAASELFILREQIVALEEKGQWLREENERLRQTQPLLHFSRPEGDPLLKEKVDDETIYRIALRNDGGSVATRVRVILQWDDEDWTCLIARDGMLRIMGKSVDEVRSGIDLQPGQTEFVELVFTGLMGGGGAHVRYVEDLQPNYLPASGHDVRMRIVARSNNAPPFTRGFLLAVAGAFSESLSTAHITMLEDAAPPVGDS